ncbi:transcriptional regulator GcvA [Rhodospirillaceae bacterium SYSU D60014]|uniref:transcriptional regulator GcvA n=1 Tax=Virgifigura deserti TaxID=2268457 RepID=UPI000E664519
MADRLPPLKAVHYFVVAARLLSFTRAAQELHVTHSAVSHQIKALEDWLGVPLFRRLNRTVVLTEAGQSYLKPLREIFERLADASRQVRQQDQSGPLTVSTMPSFAAKWLVPRLRGFRERHPEIDVRISATEKLVDFERDDVDLAIRYGRGNWPGLRIEPLLTEHLFPVCSPKLLEGPAPLRVPADLAHHPLLHDSDWNEDFWSRWLAVAGVDGVSPRRALSFNYSNLMLQAAIDGLGVALSHNALAGDDLAAGRLVKPFDICLPTEFAFYLVAPESNADRPKIVAFRDWLLAEAARGKGAE